MDGVERITLARRADALFFRAGEDVSWSLGKPLVVVAVDTVEGWVDVRPMTRWERVKLFFRRLWWSVRP
jgi:hypothetical protein